MPNNLQVQHLRDVVHMIDTMNKICQIESKAVRKLQQPYRAKALVSFLDGAELAVMESSDAI